MADSLTDFLFPDLGVRGALIEINSDIEKLLDSRPYSADVRNLLGQAIVAMPLLASHSKFEGRINLQFQGKGDLKLLVAQIDRHLTVRGMAKAAPDVAGDFQSLMHGGLLAMMLEPDRGSEHYHALVDVVGSTLAEALENYFRQSEQLPTLLRLAASENRLAGILLQRMPDGVGDENGWEHVSHLFATLGEAELVSADTATLMRRLFHAENLRLFEPSPVKLSCRCDRGSIATMLLGMGEDEVVPALKEQGKVEVTCEFCGSVYVFTPLEVTELFAASASEPALTQH
jgi:molecular chaperone Hsp33